MKNYFFATGRKKTSQQKIAKTEISILQLNENHCFKIKVTNIKEASTTELPSGTRSISAA
jgi:hypothetical protein